MNPNKVPKYQNEEWLRKQYLELNRKVIDIAKERSVTRKTIHLWLRRFQIPKRKQNTWNVGKTYHQIEGVNNPNWKGSKAGYKCIHDWVRKRKKKPKACQKCGRVQDYLELANISGEYKRDINDYIYLCVRCHKKMDGTLSRFIKGGETTRFKKGHKNELRWRVART